MSMRMPRLKRTMSRPPGDNGRLLFLASRRHFLIHDLLRKSLNLLGVWAYFLHRLLKYLFTNTQRRPLPRRNSDTNARHLVFPQVAYPPVHNDRVRIPCLYDALVYASLKILLTFFVDERSSKDGPHRPLCWKWYRARCRDAQRARRMPGKMRKEVEWVVVVRPEVNLGDRNSVRTGNCRWRV